MTNITQKIQSAVREAIHASFNGLKVKTVGYETQIFTYVNGNGVKCIRIKHYGSTLFILRLHETGMTLEVTDNAFYSISSLKRLRAIVPMHKSKHGYNSPYGVDMPISEIINKEIEYTF